MCLAGECACFRHCGRLGAPRDSGGVDHSASLQALVEAARRTCPRCVAIRALAHLDVLQEDDVSDPAVIGTALSYLRSIASDIGPLCHRHGGDR